MTSMLRAFLQIEAPGNLKKARYQRFFSANKMFKKLCRKNETFFFSFFFSGTDVSMLKILKLIYANNEYLLVLKIFLCCQSSSH